MKKIKACDICDNFFDLNYEEIKLVEMERSELYLCNDCDDTYKNRNDIETFFIEKEKEIEKYLKRLKKKNSIEAIHISNYLYTMKNKKKNIFETKKRKDVEN